jgi:hypothetical protein
VAGLHDGHLAAFQAARLDIGCGRTGLHVLRAHHGELVAVGVVLAESAGP